MLLIRQALGIRVNYLEGAMNQRITEVKESLTLILKKLESIESKIERQEADIKTYMEKSFSHLDSNELLEAGLKSTRTSVEVLRDEIDELHQIVMVLSQELNNE